MPTPITRPPARDLTKLARRSLLTALLACNAASAAAALAVEPGAAASAPPSTDTVRRTTRGTGTTFNVDLKGSVYYLASDELEGRGVGTRGLDRAADFVADNFMKLGLKPPPGQDDYFQHFKLTTVVKPGADTALKWTGGRGADASAYALRGDYIPLSFSAEKHFDGPVVFAGYSIASKDHHYDDFAGVDVKGRVALALRYEPHDNQGHSRFTGKEEWSGEATLARKAAAAAEAGAAALVLVNPPAFHEEDDNLVPFVRTYRGEQAKIPVLQVRRKVVDEWLREANIGQDLRALQRTIDDGGNPASFEFPEGFRLSGGVSIDRQQQDVKNVVAVLPGSGNLAHEFVVVGAHNDHLGRGGAGSLAPQTPEIHNGADDNASGTTAVLELAEHYAKRGTNGRSMIFCAFTAEEIGLVGSQHFVTHPPVPLPRIAYMVNLDMVGRIRNDILYVGGHGTAPVFDSAINKADAKSPLRFKSFGAGGFGPSDHMSFALKKIPVLFIHSGQHRDYHRPTDDADKVNYEGMRQAVDFTADVIDQLLAAPKQQYVDAADAHSMFNGAGAPGGPSTGSASGGLRVSLGVVPDYAPDETIKGLRISGTMPGSPAAAAGLQDGDVIVQIGKDQIDSIYDLTDVLRKGKPGDKVRITALRDGKRVETEATLAARKG
jgi:hypothetical protein